MEMENYFLKNYIFKDNTCLLTVMNTHLLILSNNNLTLILLFLKKLTSYFLLFFILLINKEYVISFIGLIIMSIEYKTSQWRLSFTSQWTNNNVNRI